MPHLTKLAKQYQGKVTFLALSDEPLETVAPFLAQKSGIEEKTWGEAMAFAVATDPDKSVKDAIHTAAGRSGIPSTCIISGGKLQWVGHPMRMDGPLEQVVNGTWDLAKAREAHSEEMAAADVMKEFQKLARAAGASGDWNEALAFLDKSLEKQPGNKSLALTKWKVLLLYAQRDEEAYAYGGKLLDQIWEDAQSLNDIAWTVVDDAKVKTRDLKFALKAAERANELTKSEDGAILDTLARVHYEAGRLDDAIRWQKKAVEHAEGELADQLREVLAKYEAEKAKKG